MTTRLAALARWVRTPPRGPAADRAYSVALLVVGLALLALDVRMIGADVPFVDVPGGTLPWQVGILLLGTTALLLKRRRPVLVLVVVTALLAADVALGGSLGMYLVLFDALFTVARAAAPRARAVVLGVLVALVLAVLVGTVVAGASARDVVQLTLVAGSLLLPPWWWGSDVRRSEVLVAEQSRRADAERARADLARAHADDVARIAALDRDRAVQDERARMARDLHDVVAGHLSAVAIHAEAALAAPPDESRDRAALTAARAGSLAALAEMRSMILVLREGADADATTAPAGLARLTDLDVDVVGDVPAGLAAAVDHAAFRILQEAATNARKHGAGRAAVRFTADGDTLDVVVENALRTDAVPVNPALTSSTGLQTMRERATALGGTLTAAPTGATWRVHARLPLRPGDETR
ncbi:MAG: two-component sensor histidine kinase [Cellulomonas sp.]|uniref:sensor histidine kinase n=1 Tax=Cellulomonas sp. TaxID=40001 RepID=UPI001A09EAC8|nr:histidine kinase [Cellulomonas sp.]MBF0688481.1 two-component sensor histidine kinase [Cellulomonas sp.]